MKYKYIRQHRPYHVINQFICRIPVNDVGYWFWHDGQWEPIYSVSKYKVLKKTPNRKFWDEEITEEEAMKEIFLDVL
jgi:hypothetical protein